MRRIPVSLLLLIAGTSSLQAQTPFNQSAQGPFITGLVATIVPVVGGMTLALANGVEGDVGGAGLFMAIGGLTLGPSIGAWSGGLTGRGFAGAGLRTVVLWGGLIGGVAVSWNNDDQNTLGAVIGLSGLGIATALAIHDLATVRGAVLRHRTRGLSVVPTYQPSVHAAGLAVRLTF